MGANSVICTDGQASGEICIALPIRSPDFVFRDEYARGREELAGTTHGLISMKVEEISVECLRVQGTL